MKKHRTDGVSLTFGVLFLAIVAWWLLAQIFHLALMAVGWSAAGALILLGIFGLVGALRSKPTPDPVPPTPAAPDPATSGTATTDLGTLGGLGTPGAATPGPVADEPLGDTPTTVEPGLGNTPARRPRTDDPGTT